MLVVTVEIWPHGLEHKKRHLGTAKIINIGGRGGADLSIGDYRVELSKFDDKDKVWRRGSLEGFKRLVYGPWDLLFLGLKKVLGKARIHAIESGTDAE